MKTTRVTFAPHATLYTLSSQGQQTSMCQVALKDEPQHPSAKHYMGRKQPRSTLCSVAHALKETVASLETIKSLSPETKKGWEDSLNSLKKKSVSLGTLDQLSPLFTKAFTLLAQF